MNASSKIAALPVPSEHARRPGFFQRLFSRFRRSTPALPFVYDAEDIAEDNRITEALRRQHSLR